MNEHALQVLEYDAIRARLQRHIATAEGLRRACALTPSDSMWEVQARLTRTREASDLLRRAEPTPLGGIRDIRAAVSKARVSGFLSAHDLVQIADTIEAIRRLRGFLSTRRNAAPRLWDLAEALDTYPNLPEEIHRCIGADNELVDQASPELDRLRSQIRAVHARIHARLQSMLASQRVQGMLQEAIITVRDDRYCLPVKAEYRTQFGGIVHDVSATGATVFVEPRDVVDAGNRLRELHIAEANEEDRILAHLTGLVGAQAVSLCSNLDVIGLLDLAAGAALLGDEMHAEPPAVTEGRRLRLRNARHPLLSPPVVPTDIELNAGRRIIIITGPNTGGKTVALKTAGLLCLMALSGLYIPADAGSEIPLLREIYADIGDEQSLQQSLSTFSAHIRNIASMLPDAGADSLVLLDELGVGTDPAEGACLAQAILDRLLEQQALVLATSHYGEMKRYAYERDGVCNASVEFDAQSLRPTYRLQIGSPGSSHALVIAERLGILPSVIRQARSLLAEQQGDVDTLMKRLEAELAAVRETQAAAETRLREADTLRQQLQEARDALEQNRQQMIDQALQEARQRAAELLHQAEEAYGTLRAQPRENREAQEARKQIQQTARQVQHHTDARTRRQPLDKQQIHIGDTVRVDSMGITGVVLRIRENQMIVQSGVMEVTVPAANVRRVPGAAGAAVRPASYVSAADTPHTSGEIHLRRMRVDEALIELDTYLDTALRAGHQSVRVVHGKGTGQLRAAVRQHLRGHPLVSRFDEANANEGGAGVTIVQLR